MLKKLLAAGSACCAAAALFAYNPPVAGDRLFTFANPYLLTDGSDAAGGPILNIRPSSIVNNPAIPAQEQRVTIDLGGTFLHDDRGDDKNGAAFEAGVLIPSKWGVFTVLGDGLLAPMQDMQAGKSVSGKFGAAKDINDKLFVGLSAGAGGLWGFDSDWSLMADLGALYQPGDLGFLKDLRIGVSVLNLGKTFTESTVIGIKDAGDKAGFPTFALPKLGIAASLFESEDFVCGASVDVSAPMFQSVTVDAAVQLLFHDMFRIGTSWYMNSLELSKDAEVNMPSLIFGVKFNLKSKQTDAADAGGTDVDISAAWQRLYKHVDAYSAGTIIKVGAVDTEAPEIILW